MDFVLQVTQDFRRQPCSDAVAVVEAVAADATAVVVVVVAVVVGRRQ